MKENYSREMGNWEQIRAQWILNKAIREKSKGTVSSGIEIIIPVQKELQQWQIIELLLKELAVLNIAFLRL